MNIVWNGKLVNGILRCCSCIGGYDEITPLVVTTCCTYNIHEVLLKETYSLIVGGACNWCSPAILRVENLVESLEQQFLVVIFKTCCYLLPQLLKAYA